MSADTAVWHNIKGWGRLLLSIRSANRGDGNFISMVTIAPSSGQEVSWIDEYVKHDPCELILTAATDYTVRIGVKFLSESVEKAVIEAKVVNASGRPMEDKEGNDTYVLEVAGKAGDTTRRATLMLAHGTGTWCGISVFPSHALTSIR